MHCGRDRLTSTVKRWMTNNTHLWIANKRLSPKPCSTLATIGHEDHFKFTKTCLHIDDNTRWLYHKLSCRKITYEKTTIECSRVSGVWRLPRLWMIFFLVTCANMWCMLQSCVEAGSVSQMQNYLAWYKSCKTILACIVPYNCFQNHHVVKVFPAHNERN